MRKINVILVMALLLVGTFGTFLVSADEQDSETSAGIVNENKVSLDDDIVYPELSEARNVGAFENFKDSVRLAFTFDRERRILLWLERAEKRYNEFQNNEDDPEKQARAKKIYSFYLKRAHDALEKLNDDDKIARAYEKFEAHEKKIELVHEKHLKMLERTSASEEKKERFEAFYIDAKENLDLREQKFIAKKKLIAKGESSVPAHSEIRAVDDSSVVKAVEISSEKKLFSIESDWKNLIKKIESSDLPSEEKKEIFNKMQNALNDEDSGHGINTQIYRDIVARIQGAVQNGDLTPEQILHFRIRLWNFLADHGIYPNGGEPNFDEDAFSLAFDPIELEEPIETNEFALAN